MSSNGWKEVKLGEVAHVLSGYAFKSIDFCDNGIPVIKIKNIAPPYVNLQDVQYVPQNLSDEKSRYKLIYNDVLISLTGSNVNQFASAVGKVGRIKINKPMMLNQRVGKFEILDQSVYNLDFLYYFISTEDMHYKLAINASGAANQANISPSMIKNIDLPCPPIDEQKAIVAILLCLDDKIELNNRINKTLEEIAHAIFKSWFVDFVPFQEGEFEDSEFGRIPKGWRVYELGDVVEIINGYSYKGVELKKSEDALVTIKNFDRNGGFKIDGFKEFEVSNRVKDHHYLNLYDVIIACTDLTQNAEIIGNPILVLTKSKFDNLIASMDLIRIISKASNISNCLLYTLLKDGNFKQFALGYTSGTTVLHLDKKGILQYKMVLPSDTQILMNFSDIIEPLFKSISEKINESEKLISIRNNLLPKLMSGEIRVPIEEVQ